MSKLSWQQWTAIGLVLAFIITAVVLHLVQPKISYAFAEVIGLLTFALGLATGYLLSKKKNKTDRSLLLD